jgi:hypothetical protein
MSVSQIALGIPASIQSLIQQNVLERVFHENLFPRLLYRSEAMPELWPANLGEVKIFTRPGLVARTTTPLTPGSDPSPASYAFEQWIAEARQYGNTIDTHMPTSAVSLASLFLRNIQELGKGAGLSLNSLARDALFRAYFGGNTVVAVAALAGATTIRVASINGFTEKLQNARPAAVSGLNPLTVTFTNAEPANQVVGAVPDNPAEPFGPGTLQLANPLTVGLPIVGTARTGVLASNRSRMTFAGGATTVDGITAVNTLGLQDIINTVATMRANNVPPTADGYYHVHVTPEGEAQLYADQQFRQLFQSLPDSMEYRDLAIGQLIGCRFYRNVENPNTQTVAGTVASGAGAQAAPEVGGDVVNGAGLPLRYAMVIGGGALYEPYIDESRYISEAGVTGKIGEFSITNGGVQVMTDRIRLSIRSPLDRLQQVVSATWSWSGDFAVPSDELTGSPARYKRSAIIAHA